MKELASVEERTAKARVREELAKAEMVAQLTKEAEERLQEMYEEIKKREQVNTRFSVAHHEAREAERKAEEARILDEQKRIDNIVMIQDKLKNKL